MQIYLAGSCASEQRTVMVSIAAALRKANYKVYCPFELKIPNAWDMSQERWGQKVFEADIAAINEADIFLMITPGRQSSAGTNWEQGYAYAIGKTIFVFQITEETTSLMTYAGCNYFFNVTNKDLPEYIVQTLKDYTGQDLRTKNPCKTVLT